MVVSLQRKISWRGIAGGIACLPLALLQAQCQQKAATPDAIAEISAPFEMPKITRPNIPQRFVNIRDFGAVTGGGVKNTKSIQAAIDSVVKSGGGSVVVPEGRWLTGAIRLGNNVDLHLDRGAELLFSQDTADYLPVVFSRHEDVECYKYSAFVYANGVSNISITGAGTLNGQGKPWWSYKKDNSRSEKLLFEMAANGVPVGERIFDGKDGRALRPAFFQPMNCTNVLVEGVTFLYGGFWTVTPTYCENVIVRNVRIKTTGEYGNTPNGDGVNPSSCRNVLIENCDFDTGDDCIAIKAGRDTDGLRVDRPTENVVIRNCRGLNGHGGIVIGSETSGGIRNVYAESCSFSGTDRLIRIKSARGRGGVIENLWFVDIRGENIRNEAIHINMLYAGTRLPEMPVSRETPSVRNVHYRNVTSSGGKGYGIELIGLPELPVEQIDFDNVTVGGVKGARLADVRDVRFTGSRIESGESPAVAIESGAGIVFDSVTFSSAGPQLIDVGGKASAGITLRRTNINSLEGAVTLRPEVPAGAVSIVR